MFSSNFDFESPVEMGSGVAQVEEGGGDIHNQSDVIKNNTM
jgi:hypothetical protein